MDPTAGSAPPRFAASLFGYDRYQVEEYVGRLHEWVDQAERRASETQRALSQREEELRLLRAAIDPESLPTDLAGVGALAVVAACDDLVALRRRAADQSAEVLASARAEALEVLGAAHRLSADIAARAEAPPARGSEVAGGPEPRLRAVSDDLSTLSEMLNRFLGEIDGWDGAGGPAPVAAMQQPGGPTGGS